VGGLRRVVSLGKAPADRHDADDEIGPPVPLPPGKGVASDDRSFSNFVVADRPLGSCGVRCSPRALSDHSPTLAAGPRRNDRARAGPSRSKTSPAPLRSRALFPRPGRERNNIASKATLCAAVHAEVIDWRAYPGRGRPTFDREVAKTGCSRATIAKVAKRAA
jgi:hypothetical protein